MNLTKARKLCDAIEDITEIITTTLEIIILVGLVEIIIGVILSGR